MIDIKKEMKHLFPNKTTPSIVEVPQMNYLSVRGSGNPNDENGAYQKAIEMLYGVAYTLRMSYKTDYQIPDYQPYVVPPLEGFWWQEGIEGYDPDRKDDFEWHALISLPGFIQPEAVKWAIETASLKKKADFSPVTFMTFNEGLVVQCLHIGPYDTEAETVEKMTQLINQEGYAYDYSSERMHHEIYMSDPRKVTPDKNKVILRLPIKKI